MSQFKVTAKSKDFGYAVKLLKKRGGGEYDGGTKVWTVSDSTAAALRQYPEYFTEVAAAGSMFVTDASGETELAH